MEEGKSLPCRGRPGKAEAGRRQALILEVATESFLSCGYAETSIEAIASKARVAKRTLYARWRNKAALFRGVIERLIAGWRQETEFDTEADLEAALLALARHILNVALAPHALALHRLMIAESGRFPELVSILEAAGGGLARERVVRLLQRAAGPASIDAEEANFAAEQFIRLVLSGPQHRALGLGTPLDRTALKAWAAQSVRLFLNGWRAQVTSHTVQPVG